MEVRKGYRYRAATDLSLICLTHWRRPFTGGLQVILPAGEVVVVSEDPPSFAKGVGLQPERYEDFLKLFIPESDRKADGFDGYSLAVSFDELAAAFVRIT